MISKCPGSMGFREPTPEAMNCPVCGREIEIWTDEAKASCPHCGVNVMREGNATTCLDWCRYAKMCVGEELYKRYLKNKETIREGHHAKRKDDKGLKQAD